MIYTQHIEARMQQRGMPGDVVQAIFAEGAMNQRGDKVVLKGRDLEEALAEKAYEIADRRRRLQKLDRSATSFDWTQAALSQEIARLQQEREPLDRLRRKGGGVLVMVGEHALTVYGSFGRKRR